MSQTETEGAASAPSTAGSPVVDQSTQLAIALFDEVVVPLAEARRASDAEPFFPLSGDDNVSTYFQKPIVSAMGAADFEPHSGDANGLLDALTMYWEAGGEPELAALVPRMRQIADALESEMEQSSGDVDVLCYTLF